MRNKPLIAIMSLAILATIVAGIFMARIEKEYLQKHSFFFDPVYYSYYNAVLFEKINVSGRWAVAGDELAHNSRHPLRTLPLVVFSPKTLAHPLGHMATALPILAVFLSLLGWTLYQRTGTLSYSLGGMLLFTCIPGLYRPVLGYAAYWLDFPAALLISSAAFCLINSHQARDYKWLSLGAILLSAAVLCRYILVIPAVFTCGPVFGWFLYLRWRAERNFNQAVLKPGLLVLGIIGVIAGYFLLSHFKENILFYTNYGYGLNQGYITAAKHVLSAMAKYLFWDGTAPVYELLIILVVLFVSNFLMYYQRQEWWLTASLVWLSIANILFHISAQAIATNHTAINGIPLLFTLLLSPYTWEKPKNKACWAKLKVMGLVIVALLMLIRVGQIYQNEVKTCPDDRKKTAQVIAAHLSDQGEHVVWNTFFDEFSWIPAMEAFNNSQKLPLPAGQKYFNTNELAWQSDYPNLSVDKIAEKVYNNSLQWLNMAVVLADPRTADTNMYMTNQYSRYVAKYMSIRIAGDQHWKKVFTVTSSKYGNLAGYINKSTRPDNYEQFLMGNASINP